MTRTIGAGEFKAKCLRLIDEVNESGEPLIVTKRGKPVVEVRPAAAKPKRLFGAMKGRIKILGDIIEPIDVEWEAMAGDSFK
jgi:prevent-host-death family protein